jgi:hypothetical protein
MSPGYCPYDSCAVGGDWACPPHAPGDASGGAAGVVGGVDGGSALPGDITASPAALGCDFTGGDITSSPDYSSFSGESGHCSYPADSTVLQAGPSDHPSPVLLPAVTISGLGCGTEVSKQGQYHTEYGTLQGM